MGLFLDPLASVNEARGLHGTATTPSITICAENQAIWPVTALHRYHGLDHLDRQKTTAERPSEGTTTPESYPSPRSLRSGWRPGPTQGSLPPLQDRRPTLHGLGGHWVDHLPGASGRFSGYHRRTLGGVDGWVGDREVMHEFWLADIRDSCIIGLDLLTRWGARVDMAGAAITVGTENVALQSGRGGDSGGRRSSRRAMARRPRPLPGPCAPRSPVSASFPSPETAEAVNALWLRSGVGLDVQQSQLLLEEGTVKDGVYRRHPPAGDREHLDLPPNQRDGGHLAAGRRKARSQHKRGYGTGAEERQEYASNARPRGSRRP
ncbi:unnamed protein product [Boreogadus saida]